MPRILVTVALVGLSATASAGVIDAFQIVGNSVPGVHFEAVSPRPSPLLETKSQGGRTGAGVKGGRTDGEIDTDEAIVATFATPVTIDFIDLMLLFDGPEYDDTEEKAQIRGWGPGTPETEPAVALLTASFGPSASWSGPDMGMAMVTPPSDAIEGGAALWHWTNPFGDMLISRLEFTAVPNVPAHPGPWPDGDCLNGGGCTNDSDYSIESLGYSEAPPSEVPEPGTVALLGAGLAGLWTAARRRRPSP